MRYAFCAIGMGLLMPLCVYAQAAPGFATDPVFLSKSPVVEGESVRIYASITNPTASAFEGIVTLRDGGNIIGGISVTLSSGEARVVSIVWKPESGGTHDITAELEDNDGKTISKTAATVAITPKPPANIPLNNADPSSMAVESSAPLEEHIASLIPQAASVTAPVLQAIDSARAAAANVLDAQLAQTKPKLPGTISGSEASSGNPPGSSIGRTAINIFWTFYFYLLSILRYIIGSIAFSYPLLALAFLYLLYRLYRRMTGPRRTY